MCRYLSGVEPQSLHILNMNHSALPAFASKTLIVCGQPAVALRTYHVGDVTLVSHLPDEDWPPAQRSEKIISRSGYSSIMDLKALGCPDKTEFIPIPGQTEQEYLFELQRNRWVDSFGFQSSGFLSFVWLQKKTVGDFIQRFLSVTVLQNSLFTKSGLLSSWIIIGVAVAPSFVVIRTAFRSRFRFVFRLVWLLPPIFHFFCSVHGSLLRVFLHFGKLLFCSLFCGLTNFCCRTTVIWIKYFLCCYWGSESAAFFSSLFERLFISAFEFIRLFSFLCASFVSDVGVASGVIVINCSSVLSLQCYCLRCIAWRPSISYLFLHLHFAEFPVGIPHCIIVALKPNSVICKLVRF